jgi:D-alanyl-lipoteichoic acid acyltransferase DltB (MBOAT superfamily)
MLFDTFPYWAFFVAILVVLALLRDRPAKLLLVAASYAFYAAWDWRFCLLLALSTAANYRFGRAIDAREGPARKRMLVLAVGFNLALLGFFKYCNFFVASFAALIGADPGGMLLNIVLPVGISFFTFEGIAYAADVHRRQLPAVQGKADFALFVSFFPHLVAGPIIRPTDFFPQLARRAEVASRDARWGLREILKGLFKKVALANLFAPIADAGFDGGLYAGGAVPAWAGVLAFSMQIYFDFSGYTDIARGCARLLGFSFPPNFERPYLAADITDFWRRWHISLSSWLRDYLYVPLGGNRLGLPRTWLNLLIVMGLGGLWHGASWNFALWGLYHGGLLIAHRAWREAGLSLPAVLAVPCTFLLVTLGWVPFRAADFDATRATLAALAQWPDLAFAAAHPAIWGVPLATLAFCLLDRGRRLQDWLVHEASLPAAAATGALALFALEIFARIDTQVPFVYFQF